MSLCSCSGRERRPRPLVLHSRSSSSSASWCGDLQHRRWGQGAEGRGREGRGSRENCGAELEDLSPSFWGDSRGRAAPPAHEPKSICWLLGLLGSHSGNPLGCQEGSQRKTGLPKLCMHLTPIQNRPSRDRLKSHRVQDGKIFGALSRPNPELEVRGLLSSQLWHKKSSTLES